MSYAIINTQNNLGLRTLSAYNPRTVKRGPAEPGPRSAENPVTLGVMMEIPHPTSHMIRGPRIAVENEVMHPYVSAVAAPPNVNANGTGSQSPTGSIVNATQPINSQINPSVANVLPPASEPTPTATATIAPASQAGYVVINSGGGTTGQVAPDYVDEIETFLTNQSLISGIPNWMPILGAAALLMFLSSGSKRR